MGDWKIVIGGNCVETLLVYMDWEGEIRSKCSLTSVKGIDSIW
jgi:hypothetical protein